MARGLCAVWFEYKGVHRGADGGAAGVLSHDAKCECSGPVGAGDCASRGRSLRMGM